MEPAGTIRRRHKGPDRPGLCRVQARIASCAIALMLAYRYRQTSP
jgi:hypothetical protein